MQTLKCFLRNFSTLLLILWYANAQLSSNNQNLEEYLKGVNETFSKYGNQEMVARWNYITNVTNSNEETMVTY